MSAKFKFFAAVVAVASIIGFAVADDDGDVPIIRDPNVGYQITPPRPSVLIPAEPLPGAQVAPALPAEWLAIEQPIMEQIRALSNNLISASEVEQQSRQERIMALKSQLEIARFEWSLAQVRAAGDSEAEARIQEQLNHLRNPQPATRYSGPIDPVTLKPVGGAR